MDDREERPSARSNTWETASPPTHDGPPRKRQAGVAALRSLVAVASIAALVATALGWATLDKLKGNVSTSKVLADVPDAPPSGDGANDILLVGNDSRTDAQGNPLPLHVLKALRTESTTGLNTDTLILLRVPKNGAPPTAVSIPRDTYAPMAGHGPKKINSIYGLAKTAAKNKLDDSGRDPSRVERESNLAGQRELVRTVQTLTGARVDHYAEVNLLGFYEVTEAIGGVDVCLKQATRDKDSGARFRAGHQTISGGDALAFVRQRHGLPRGDLDRIVRQQVFMASLVDKILSTGTLVDPAKLDGLMRAAHKSVVLDEGWDVVKFAQRMQSLAGGSVRFVTMPIANTGTQNEQGQSIITVDPARVRGFIAGLANPNPAAPPTPTGQNKPTSENAPGSPTPTGLGPHPLLRLDGASLRQAGKPTLRQTGTAPPEITSDGVACVN